MAAGLVCMDTSNDQTKKANSLSLYLALFPVFALIALIVLLHQFLQGFAIAQLVFEPPLLLPILNTVFVSFSFWMVCYISTRSYLISGSPTILFLG